jgi:uncharacterized membrane protein YcfT
VIRDGWGDAVKGVLIVLVVFWHVVMKTLLQVDWHLGVPVPGVWGTLGDVVWPFLMPLFLLVSGVYASNALRRPWAVVARTRILRFVYLYLLWTLIHTAALWAFPEFPTFVPRSVGKFVEAVTISPMDTWYLYALAAYFAVAKALVRLPSWTVIAAAALLSVIVSTGAVEVVSNRGQFLADLVYFLIGIYLGPPLRRIVPRTTVPIALGLVGVYGAAFVAMRATGTQEAPGVWPAVSLLGVTTGLAVVPVVARIRALGPAIEYLGRHSLPIYLVHMPLLAIADTVLTDRLSAARGAVQLVAAITLPVVLTGGLILASLLIGRLADRDGARWLFALPERGREAVAPHRRSDAPWRLGVATVLLAACGVAATHTSAIPGCVGTALARDAQRPGSVTIGAVGDVLMYDVGHQVPTDGGRGHFDAVRSLFGQDLVTGNLEQVLSDDTGFDKCGGREDCLAFRSAPDTAEYLDGFDIMNLANNHTSDFGPEGYANTEAALAAAGIASVGARDQVVCANIGGTRVATIGFAPYSGTNRVTDLRHVRKLVAAAKSTADIVIVHAHMGAEGPDANVVGHGTETMYGEDRGNPRAFAHAAVDAGADVVIGHGPHSLRGIEFRNGRLIAYSLGNFGGGGVFGAEQATRYGVYLDLTLRDNGSFEAGRLRSIDFGYRDGQPTPDQTGRAAKLVDRFGRRDFPFSAPIIDAKGGLHRPPSKG